MGGLKTMNEFYSNNKLSLPQRVNYNSEQIEELKRVVLAYKSYIDLTTSSTSVLKANTNVDDAKYGYLIDPHGLMFKIVSVTATTVYLEYYATLGTYGVDLVNVKTFGAIGDGTTDDTLAINNAINSITKGVIFVPRGTYLISGAINLKNDIVLMGEGNATTFKVKDNININDNIIKVVNASNVVLADFAIDGNRANQDETLYTQYAVFVSNTQNVTVDNVHVYNANGVGIQIYASNNCTVFNCKSHGNRYHGYECEQCTNCVFDTCYGYNNDRHGVFVSPGEVGGTGSINNTITNCCFNGNTQYGIAFGVDAQGISIGLSKNNLVENCQVNGNGYYGISIYRVDNCIINGNNITNNGAFGIQIYMSVNNIICNNKLYHNSTLGSGLYAEIIMEGYNDGKASQQNLVANNVITPDNAPFAIVEGTANDGANFIVNNVITNSGTAGDVQIQHVNTNYELLNATIAKRLSSLKVFDKGIMIGNTNNALPSGTFGIDSPYTNVMRIFNDIGATQIVNPNGNVDFYVGGNHIMTINNNGVNMDGRFFENYVDGGGWTGVPATATSAGIKGMRAYDNNYLYICIETNTWVRTPLATW